MIEVERRKQSKVLKVTFGDVVRLSTERSRNPQDEGFERFIGLEHIDPGELRLQRWGNVSDGTTFTSVFRAGQVLFGKRRAYQRKVAVPDFIGVCSGDIYVLESKSKQLLPGFLPYVCQTDKFFQHAVSTSAGSLSPRTNWSSLAQFEFALPPVEIQQRIVAVLEAHTLSIESLRCLLACGQQLKEALLKDLFSAEGRFGTSFSELLSDGSVSIQTGPFGTVLSAKEYTDSGWPVINPTDIRDGQVVHSDGPRVSDATAERLTKYRMQGGDILLARKGEIDKACLVKDLHDGWIVGSDCIRLRSDSNRLLAPYLLYFLQSPQTAQKLASLAHGTIMRGLNEKMLARLEIPLIGLSDQDEVGARVAVIDRAIRRIQHRLQMATELRQAALTEMLGY